MLKYSLALVTGATSGIGKEICKLFAGKGINLIITGRNEGELKLLKESLSSLVSVRAIPADLSTSEGRRLIIKAIHENCPDLVINNAGFGYIGEALSYQTQDQVDIMEVNCRALLELSLEGARTLISKGKKGVVLNVTSAVAFQTFPFFSVYSASKTFVNQFSQAFDLEVKPYGVRILTICPGFVETNFSKRALGKNDVRRTGAMSAPCVAEQIWRQITKLQPLLVIDWKIRFLTFLTAFIPRKLKAIIGKKLMDGRVAPRSIIKLFTTETQSSQRYQEKVRKN